MRMRWFSCFDNRSIVIEGTDLVLRPPKHRDMGQWISLRTRSQDFLRQWEPSWPDNDLSPAGYRTRLAHYKRKWQENLARTYFLFGNQGSTLLGGLALTRINSDQLGYAMLGYWMGECYAGKGYMSKAVPVLVNHAFEKLKLNTVQAACLPHNNRSIHLLKKSGFERVSLVPRFLEINGKLRDHLLMQKMETNSAMSHDFQMGKASKRTGISSISMV